MLRALHPDQGDQLPLDVHLPRAQGAAEGGAGDCVRQLWMQGLFVWGLSTMFARTEQEMANRKSTEHGAALGRDEVFRPASLSTEKKRIALHGEAID